LNWQRGFIIRKPQGAADFGKRFLSMVLLFVLVIGSCFFILYLFRRDTSDGKADALTYGWGPMMAFFAFYLIRFFIPTAIKRDKELKREKSRAMAEDHDGKNAEKEG
jgi:hypothetical protein